MKQGAVSPLAQSQLQPVLSEGIPFEAHLGMASPVEQFAGILSLQRQKKLPDHLAEELAWWLWLPLKDQKDWEETLTGKLICLESHKGMVLKGWTMAGWLWEVDPCELCLIHTRTKQTACKDVIPTIELQRCVANAVKI